MTKPKRPPMVQRLKDRFKANPKINLVDMNLPLTNGESTPKLKDVLEEGTVDQKYYCKQEYVKKIVENTDFTEKLVSIKVDKE